MRRPAPPADCPFPPAQTPGREPVSWTRSPEGTGACPAALSWGLLSPGGSVAAPWVGPGAAPVRSALLPTPVSLGHRGSVWVPGRGLAPWEPDGHRAPSGALASLLPFLRPRWTFLLADSGAQQTQRIPGAPGIGVGRVNPQFPPAEQGGGSLRGNSRSKGWRQAGPQQQGSRGPFCLARGQPEFDPQHPIGSPEKH